MKRMQRDSDLLEEYDFSKGIRGKYAERYAEGTNVAVILGTPYLMMVNGYGVPRIQNSELIY